MKKQLKVLRDQIKIQTADGNWNYNPYMHGLANGLILAEATMTNSEPVFLRAPKKWLRDVKFKGIKYASTKAR
jgi:hypothetical protein